MPRFRMTWPYPRNWRDSGLRAQPGEVIESDENPDPNFFEEVDAATPVGVPEPDDAPAPPAPPVADPPQPPVIPAESPEPVAAPESEEN